MKYTCSITVNTPEEEFNDIVFSSVTFDELMAEINEKYPNATTVIIVMSL